MRKYAIIGRGKNGWHANGTDTDPDCTWSRSGGGHSILDEYLSEAQDGCLVYDADEADYQPFAELVFRGPMVDPSLEPGTIDPFNSDMKKAALGMLPALQDGFRAMAVMAISGLGSLDRCAPDVYIQLLKEKVPGVKTGKVVNHKIEWDAPVSLPTGDD